MQMREFWSPVGVRIFGAGSATVTYHGLGTILANYCGHVRQWAIGVWIRDARVSFRSIVSRGTVLAFAC